jgi:hypothetical protein
VVLGFSLRYTIQQFGNACQGFFAPVAEGDANSDLTYNAAEVKWAHPKESAKQN